MVSTSRQIAIKIIEEFEDLLEQKDITIPSQDREGNEEEARLYGKEYYMIEDKISRIIEEELPQILEQTLKEEID